MAGVYKGLTIKIEADDGDLQRALDRNARQASKLQRELKQVEKGLKFDPKSPQMLAQKMQKVSQQADSTAARLKLLKKAESEIGRTGMSTEQWTELQGDIAACEAKLRSFNGQLREMAVQQAADGSALGKVGNFLQDNEEAFERVGGNMQKVGGLLTATVTPAIAVGAAASVKAAVDIDTALTGVRKTVDGTEEDYQRLKDAAIEFSKTNATSAKDFLDAEALGAQLGFAIDELQLFAEVATGLDIATNMDLDTAASEMARFANITGMGHDEIENYASAIVNVGNNMATTESEVSTLAMRLAAAGTQVGMSQADILGLAGALSSLGVEAEAGGTAVSTIMSTIDKAVATNDASLETWAGAAKMSAEEFASAWQSNPVEALSAVLSGMEEATAEGGNMSLMLEELGISSLRQTDVLKRMAGASQLVADGVRIANEGWNENTALADEVANRNDSIAAKFEMLKNRLIAVAEEVGEPIADAMLEAVDAAEPLFEAIENGARAFSDMSREEQQAVLQTVGFFAVLGPAVGVLGRVVSAIGPMGAGMQALAKGLAGADMAGFAKGADAVAGSATAMGGAVQGAGAATKIAAATMGALKAGAVVGVVAVLGIVASKAVEYCQHVSEAGELTESLGKTAHDTAYAMSGFRDAQGDVAGAVDGATGAVERQSGSIMEDREAMYRAVDAAGEFERKMSDVASSTGSTNGELSSYYGVLDRYLDKPRLAADKLAELKLAVEGVNDLCGTSYEVQGTYADGYHLVEDGARKAKDEILKLIESQKLQFQVEGYQEMARAGEESLRTQREEMAKVQEKIADLNAELEGLGTTAADSAARTETNNQIKQLEGDYARMSAVYQETSAGLDVLYDNMTFTTMAMEDMDGVAAKIAGNGALFDAFSRASEDIAPFATLMQEAGVSAEGLAKVGPEAAAKIAAAYDGSFSSIESALTSAGVEFDGFRASQVKVAEDVGSKWKALDPKVRMALSDMEMSTRDYALALLDAGVHTEDLSRLSSEQLGKIATECGDDFTRAAVYASSWADETRESFARAFGENGVDVEQLAESVGRSVDQLALDMQQAGISIDQASSLGTEGFSRLVQAAGGDLEAVASQLERLEELKIDPKEFQVTDDGSIADKTGAIIDLDAMTVGGKPFWVDDNGTIQVLEGEVEELDASYVADKDFRVNDDGTVTVWNQELANLDGVKIGDKHYKVVTEGKDDAIGQLDQVRNYSIPGKSVNVSANTGSFWSSISGILNTAISKTVSIFGSFSGPGKKAGGVIPQHMAGAIFTGPTLTDIGLVGEAGAEAYLPGARGSGAIVPLTNRRYVRPFAQAVASEMGGQRTVLNVNVNLDYRAGDDAAQMARDVASRLESLLDMEA